MSGELIRHGYRLSAQAAAAALRSEKATWTPDTGRASFNDRDNFVTNRVTVADYHDGRQVGETAVLGLAAAWACVNLLAGTTASLPLMVYRTDAQGRRTVAYDHPLYRVLHSSPNADQTAYDFWEFTTCCIEMRGNSYSEIERASDGRVIALDVPFAPTCVNVRRLSNGELQYEVSDGTRRTVPQDRMLHIRGFGGSPLGGLSALTYGARIFGGAIQTETASSAMFSNGMRPSVVLESDKPFTGPQRKEAEELLQTKYIGSMNAGVPFLADNGLKLKALSFDAEAAQMIESRGFSVEQICMFLDVPPHLIGHTAGNTQLGSSIGEQTLGFVKFKMRRRLKRIEQALEKQLLTPADRAQGMTIEFNLEGLLRGDTTARYQAYDVALKGKWKTINEVRALENEPPVPWGNRPWGQEQDIQLQEDGTVPPVRGRQEEE